MTTKTGLGKGLGALLGSSTAATLAAAQPDAARGESVRQVSLAQIVPSPLQPRKRFTPEVLAELAASIAESGILQPLIVRQVGAKFELIAGERRWRAAQKAGLKTAPVIVRAANDQEVLELALVENLQRADLNPMEEAEGYARLAQAFKLTQEQIAKRVGKNRASVANALRLLNLPPQVRAHVAEGGLSAGHAKVLAGITNAAQQRALAEHTVREGLSVRQLEQLAGAARGKISAKSSSKSKRPSTDTSLRDLERKLQQVLATRVKISGTAKSGKIEVSYFSLDDLERVLKLLGVRHL